MSEGRDILLDMPPLEHETWQDWFDNLTQSGKAELKVLSEKLPRVGPIKGPQLTAFNSSADIVGYGGAAGGGKAEVNQALTQTPCGPVEIGSLVVGQKICDAFGGIQQVNGIREWENWKVWRVQFSDGTHVDVAPEHEWTGWWSHRGIQVRKAGGRQRLCGPDGAVKLETQQILRLMEANPKENRFRVPLCEPTVGNFNRNKIDPYLLGVCLGDGHMSKRMGCRISLHKDDAEILERIKTTADIFTISEYPSNPDMLTGHVSARSIENVQLRNMGMLGKRAWEKELPSSTCFAPVEWRWELLRGLMDTDGHAEPKRCAYYTTTSPKLRDGVAALARSLGCFVTVTNKFPTYTYNNEKLQGRDAYALRIKSANPESLFHLRRKKKIASEFSHQSLAKEIVDIEDTGCRETMRCINVSHPSGLYLTNDYTVTHNSALILILALLKHRRTVVFRYDAKQLRGMIDDLIDFVGTSTGLNRQAGVFYFGDQQDHMMEWGGLGKPGSEMDWRGRAHDFLAADEITELSRKKLLFLMTWMRTTIKGQRCRALFTFNPPGSVEDATGAIPTGRWVIPFFAPWIDERHIDQAYPGDSRFFVTNEEGESEEVPNREPRIIELKGKKFEQIPRSRTFVPATVQDNPYLAGTDYEQTLLALDEPFRSQMLLGDFRSGIIDHPQQVLPTEWVDEAMDRWDENGKRDDPMSAIGCDVARGGKAFTVLSPRHRWWWGELSRHKGQDTPDGHITAALCVNQVRDGATICIDANGPGASPFDILKTAGNKVIGVIGQKRKGLKKLAGSLKLYNKRTWLYWLMRLALDPARNLMPALPFDNRLRLDLITPTWGYVEGGFILVEGKEAIRERIGRSTDDGDAVILSLENIFAEGLGDRFKPGQRPLIESGERRIAHVGMGNNEWMNM